MQFNYSFALPVVRRVFHDPTLGTTAIFERPFFSFEVIHNISPSY
jgi:hypothetical protein